MVQDYKLILGVLNFIVGCLVAVTVLVMMTENYVYLIINAVTGFVGGALIGYAFGKGKMGYWKKNEAHGCRMWLVKSGESVVEEKR